MPKTRDPSADELTLQIDGKITADKFRQAVNAFLDIIEEVTRTMSGPTRTIRWIVSVQEGSARLKAWPERLAKARRRAPAVARTVEGGFRLMSRRAQRPRFFSEKALQRSRDLARIVDGKDVEGASIRFGGSVVDMSPRTAQNVDALLAPKYRDVGTVEGRLQTLSDRGGFHFVVYDALTDEPIRCVVAADRLSEAWGAFGKRVAVTGLVRYRRDGNTLSVDVETITPFPPENDLPTADDVFGILSAN